MVQTENMRSNSMPQSSVAFKFAIARLVAGLIQGLILYFLYHAVKENTWPATNEFLFAPLLLVFSTVPVILISSLGHLAARQTTIWILVSTAVISLLGLYDIWRGGTGYSNWLNQANNIHTHFPSGQFFLFSIAGFYIAHSLILAGVIDHRRIAKYSVYFEVAWKLLIQIAFSVLFVGALWLVLWLGASLFMLVKINFLKELLQESWFAIPVTAMAFSCAVHITDVRPAIIRGIRSLLLVLLSWILPIAGLIVAGFLLCLPWTGLEALWATRYATSVLIGTAAVLILLINAAFQNGEVEADVAPVVRISARGAALLLLPIVAIALYALGLRVDQYGWSNERIIAAALLLVATCYATGYAWAACRKSGWLNSIANVNVANAFIILAVIIALFSPVADPARLSVNSQMTRLSNGKVNAANFDFNYFKFEGARYGLAALEQLKLTQHGTEAALIREKADLALKNTNRLGKVWQKSKPGDLTANITVWPKTSNLPESFLKENWNEVNFHWELPRCLTMQNQKCDAYLVDFNGDVKPGVLVIGSEKNTGASLMLNENGHWVSGGQLANSLAGCELLRKELQAGNYQFIPARFKDLEIAGQRIEVQHRNLPDLNCEVTNK